MGCTVLHALDLLALHNKKQRYNFEVESIPKYIDMLEDAQRQAGRAGRTIADETLLLFSSTAMLTSERFLRVNNPGSVNYGTRNPYTPRSSLKTFSHTSSGVHRMARP